MQIHHYTYLPETIFTDQSLSIQRLHIRIHQYLSIDYIYRFITIYPEVIFKDSLLSTRDYINRLDHPQGGPIQVCMNQNPDSASTGSPNQLLVWFLASEAFSSDQDVMCTTLCLILASSFVISGLLTETIPQNC